MRKPAIICVLTAVAAASPALAAGPVADQNAPRKSLFTSDNYYRQGDEFLTASPISHQSTNLDSTVSCRGEPQCGASDCCEPECGCNDGCSDDSCCDDGCGCGDGCDCGDGCGCGILGAAEGCSMASLIGLSECSPILIGGWSSLGYTDNNIQLSENYNDLLSFDDVPDHAHLNQQWFYVGRKVDGSNGLDVGGRIDVVYGTDAQKTQAFGNPGTAGFPPGTIFRNQGTFDASLDHGEYGWAIPQAYGELGVGDLSLKVGHFFTPVGYEVIPVTGNFFRSHSYTMYNSEPFTHTGALATWSGMERVTLYGGWALGWDTGFDQLNSGNIVIGGFAFELGEAATLTYMSTYGNFGWRDAGDDNSYNHSVVLSVDLTDNLQYIAQSDWLNITNPGVVEDESIGLNQYLIYKLNDVIGLGGRFEWWKFNGESYYEGTTGVNVHVLDNLVFRPEYRQDWSPANGIDEDTAAVDMVLTY